SRKRRHLIPRRANVSRERRPGNRVWGKPRSSATAVRGVVVTLVAAVAVENLLAVCRISRRRGSGRLRQYKRGQEQRQRERQQSESAHDTRLLAPIVVA